MLLADQIQKKKETRSTEMDEVATLKLLPKYEDKVIQILKAQGKLDDHCANHGSAADTDAKSDLLPEQSKDESGADPSQQADVELESKPVTSSICNTSSDHESSNLSEQELMSDAGGAVDTDLPLIDDPTDEKTITDSEVYCVIIVIHVICDSY